MKGGAPESRRRLSSGTPPFADGLRIDQTYLGWIHDLAITTTGRLLLFSVPNLYEVLPDLRARKVFVENSGNHYANV